MRNLIMNDNVDEASWYRGGIEEVTGSIALYDAVCLAFQQALLIDSANLAELLLRWWHSDLEVLKSELLAMASSH